MNRSNSWFARIPLPLPDINLAYLITANYLNPEINGSRLQQNRCGQGVNLNFCIAVPGLPG